MSPQPITGNTLFYGDNLPILRERIADESVDLVYLDPPFNSNRNYNVLFKDERGAESEAQITAFEDTWTWDRKAEQTYNELVTGDPRMSEMIAALRLIVGRTSPMMAYLVMMAARLVELHRVLKPTGSLYLHCDTTASHYLKLLLDTLFGPRNFRNEITWKRNFTKKGSQFAMKRLANNADIILFYGKTDQAVFNVPKVTLPDSELEGKYDKVDEQGRRYKSEPIELPRMMERPNLAFEFMGYTPKYGWMMSRDKLEQMQQAGKIYFTTGGKPRRRNYLQDYDGTEIDNIWIDIFPLGQAQSEAMGYPTQKPLALLERIIQASSNPGDIVLDPFCGCGTAIAAAQKLGRRWIGIDITALSITLQKVRLKGMFGDSLKYQVIGEPTDLQDARTLAVSSEHDGRYQFQWWALGLVDAKPLGGQAGSKQGKKGADKGIDGIINFLDDSTGKPKRVIVQVKSGHVQAGDILNLIGAVRNEAAEMGLFVTLEPPTAPMKSAAVQAGYYHSPGWGKDFPKTQIITIEELLAGKQADTPPQFGTFRQAQRVKEAEGEQKGFDF